MTEAFQVIPLTPLRRVIAARMTEAKQTIPHFRLTQEVELDALIERRDTFRKERAESDLTLTDLLIKGCAAALMDVPRVNLQWAKGQIHQYHDADIAIVTAVDGGLLTPIIRRANAKSVWEISHEARELSARARCNALKMAEISGGSFSISNLGMYGVDQFDAVINPPQCAILAIGSAKPRVLADLQKGWRVAITAHMTLSVDHRAIDGVTGAQFMSALKHRLEYPE